MIMENASIYHVQGVIDIIENQKGAHLHFLIPCSPPCEEVFSQVKSIMKQKDGLFQACNASRVLLRRYTESQFFYWKYCSYSKQFAHEYFKK